ncbi:SRPBCC family protein [Paenibacillus xanthanilyticus]|uniref:SRPBCC family protein n=1 Tax=Paenibacillus xanthanilyticus TaxID=1783531 RepID=A0ABV8K2T2_9BACL
MVDVRTQIMIGTPVEQTAAYAANPIHAPEWYVNIDSAEWVRGHQVEIGAQAAFRARFLGKPLSYVYEIAAYEPGKLLVMRTANGPFPMETTYTWEAAGDHATRMTLRNRGTPRGFSALVSPLMGFMMRRANINDLRTLKKLLEQPTLHK